VTLAPEEAADAGLLERLNRLSVTRSFTPQIDVDWAQGTTDAEYGLLYEAWSLLHGTGLDAGWDEAARVVFVKYQQMNLMSFTGLLERHAIATLARLYDLDPAEPFSEYVGHFIKEEIYHHMLFSRAVAVIQAGVTDYPPLPTRRIDALLRQVFTFANLLPGRKLRTTLVFTILRFAEQVTIYAHQMVQSRLPRKESLVAQVWAFHALDESRHLAFDALILERNRLPRGLGWLPLAVAAPCCALLSLCLNANELWIARKLGVPVHLWHLPMLMRRTQAPFKRRVFGLVRETLRGGG
jgi:hypothetical protein